MKKFTAMLLSSALVLSSVTTAFASDLDPIEDSGSGSGVVTTVTYDQIVTVTVPTSASFNFVFDPQGIYYLTDEEIDELIVNEDGLLGEDDNGTWTALPNAGQIIFSDYAPFFINKSNFEVAVEIELTFTDGDDDTTIVALADPDDIGGGTVGDEAEVFIGATFSTADVQSTPEAFSGTITAPVLDATTGALKPMFIFDASDYNDVTTTTRDNDDKITSVLVEQRKVMSEDAIGHGTQFVLTGQCNTAADWDAVLKTTGIDPAITIEFTFTPPAATAWEITDEVTAGADIAGAYGLVVGNSLTAADFVTNAVSKTFLTSDELAAVNATNAAISAAGNAADATDTLDTAITTFGIDDDADALVLAISVADSVLQDAEETLEAALAAITAAETAELDDDSTAIYDDLVEAADTLDDAITALETKIGEAEPLVEEAIAIARADSAATDATNAKDAAVSATSVLNTAISDYEGLPDPQESDNNTLSDAISVAQTALSTAQTAISTAKDARTDANTAGISSDASYTDLNDAITAFESAITALQAEIRSANSLISSTPVILSNQSISEGTEISVIPTGFTFPSGALPMRTMATVEVSRSEITGGETYQVQLGIGEGGEPHPATFSGTKAMNSATGYVANIDGSTFSYDAGTGTLTMSYLPAADNVLIVAYNDYRSWTFTLNILP